MYHKLQYISQGTTANEHLQHIREVLDAGCQWIQLRMKNFSAEEIEKTASQVRIFCDQYHATFIINDNVAIAKNCLADGVHLGLTDMPIGKAREILGEAKLIGGTANTLEDVVQRISEKCNYIGLGPYRFTTTKEKLSPVLGIEGYREIVSRLTEMQLKTPLYAIGGILAEDIDNIIHTGIYGVAVSGVLTKEDNKKQIIRQLKAALL